MLSSLDFHSQIWDNLQNAHKAVIPELHTWLFPCVFKKCWLCSENWKVAGLTANQEQGKAGLLSVQQLLVGVR